MLRNTFCHIPGVGVKTEQNLWSSGIHTWEDYLRVLEGSSSSKRRIRNWRDHIDRSIEHLDNTDPNYFSENLPPNQHWRMFPEFQGSVAYIDIETTGLGNPGDYITTIALYDGKKIYHYINGDNLDDFVKDIKKYDVIISYNGKCFDVPFIRNYFGTEMNHAHIDLRYVLSSLGYSGGLKGCEKKLGLDRNELEGVDGFFAVLLWDEYKREGDPKSLETLLAYNIQDVITLETLMILSYNMKLKDTPFESSHLLPQTSQPEVPFKADVDTINRIRSRMISWY